MNQNLSSLQETRQKIDQIDDEIHRLIMQRTELVKEVAKAKGLNKKSGKNQIALRPSREAQILRRLKKNHKGAFPIEVLTRIWREIFGAITKLQNDLDMAVYMPKRGAGYLEIARDHFGAYTKFKVCGSIGMVIKEIIENSVSVGVVPVLEEDEGENGKPWWFKLIAEQDERPRIIAKLPFNGPGEGRGDGQEAYVLANRKVEKSGQDRTFIVLETIEPISISAIRDILDSNKMPITSISGIRELGGIYACLIEVDDFVSDDDDRIINICNLEKFERAIIIGGYAKTFKDE